MREREHRDPRKESPVHATLASDGLADDGQGHVSSPGYSRPAWLRTGIAGCRHALTTALLLSTFAYLATGLSDPTARPSQETAEAIQTVSRQAAADLSEAMKGPPGGVDVTDDQVARVVSDQWRAHLQAMGLNAAEPADWLTTCRRASLALVGTGVSLEEIRSLENYPESERFRIHRDRLLETQRHADYWAERYTRFLVGAEDGPFLVYRRRRFRTWLGDQIRSNRRHDQLVRDLITSEGIWTDQPEVNFYTVTFDSGDGQPDPIRMAARVSRAFMGLRIDCLQCHDDFLGNVSLGDAEWLGGDGNLRVGAQDDFHQLASFFTSAVNKGLQGLQTQPADYRYQYLHATEEVDVEPNVPFRRDLLPKQPADNDRARLAMWLTHHKNKQFARASVVRVWSLLFGRSPVDSVDNVPLDVPVHPMIETLTDAFIGSGFDTRQLIRWITDSPAFQVDSRASFDVTERHENAFAVFPIVRLRSEQVAGAALQASRIKTVDRDSSFFVQLQKFGDQNDFLRRYGDLGEDEFQKETATITQRLVMLNGKLIQERSKPNPVLNACSHIAMFGPSVSESVRSLYLTILNRSPSQTELNHFVQRVESADKQQEAYSDLAWVLFNSSGFSWNH
ncbi:MAG: DUF1553 domain-containing protein [Planctomycetota bacterium]